MRAKEYARIAAQAYKLAEAIKPDEGTGTKDQYWNARQLIVYHLRTAGSEAQRIAEAVGQTEGVSK